MYFLLGACLNMPVATETGSETTALLEAVTLENLKISICLTQLLLLNGADPNLEVAGTAALHAAARLGRGDHTTLLLKSGAQLQQKDKQVSLLIMPPNPVSTNINHDSQ